MILKQETFEMDNFKKKTFILGIYFYFEKKKKLASFSGGGVNIPLLLSGRVRKNAGFFDGLLIASLVYICIQLKYVHYIHSN